MKTLTKQDKELIDFIWEWAQRNLEEECRHDGSQFIEANMIEQLKDNPESLERLFELVNACHDAAGGEL